MRSAALNLFANQHAYATRNSFTGNQSHVCFSGNCCSSKQVKFSGDNDSDNFKKSDESIKKLLQEFKQLKTEYSTEKLKKSFDKTNKDIRKSLDVIKNAKNMGEDDKYPELNDPEKFPILNETIRSDGENVKQTQNVTMEIIKGVQKEIEASLKEINSLVSKDKKQK